LSQRPARDQQRETHPTSGSMGRNGQQGPDLGEIAHRGAVQHGHAAHRARHQEGSSPAAGPGRKAIGAAPMPRHRAECQRRHHSGTKHAGIRRQMPDGSSTLVGHGLLHKTLTPPRTSRCTAGRLPARRLPR
jgi:hypothetical protein